MFKKFTVAIAVLAVMGLMAPAMAVPNNDEVIVNIEVLAEVQLWASESNINLVLEGANAENSAAYASSLNHINNVAADITVEVKGTLPAPTVGGGGIQFFIFDDGDEVDALAAIAANAYNPAGALAWDYDSVVDTPIGPQDFTNVPVSTSIAQVTTVYAAAAPGELPLPDDFTLTVEWTIVPE
jgi:hypothetical protein